MAQFTFYFYLKFLPEIWQGGILDFRENIPRNLASLGEFPTAVEQASARGVDAAPEAERGVSPEKGA